MKKICNRYVDKFGTVINACQFDGSYDSVQEIHNFISDDILTRMDYIHNEKCIKLVNNQDRKYRAYIGDYIVELINVDKSRRYVTCDKHLFESTYTLLMPYEG